MIIYEAQEPHNCTRPDSDDYYLGTIWQCDECKRVWELKYGDFGTYWNIPGRFRRYILKKRGRL